MSTYVIGDVQGCYDQLQSLLLHIQFDPTQDTLWFTGDLVNRGPHSLEVLRFVKTLGEKHHVVLGNHDLHLIALAYGIGKPHAQDTLKPVLAAKDSTELIDWLRQRPLLHHDHAQGFVMVHAGLAPPWDLAQAQSLAKEVEAILRGNSPVSFLMHLYGDRPDHWDDRLTGMERVRCILNYLTRMRFCDLEGRLNLAYKGTLANTPYGLVPWFKVPNRANKAHKIIFGHWAALNGQTHVQNVYALDTGCVWGNCLSAMRLEDEQRFHVQCDRGLLMAKATRFHV